MMNPLILQLIKTKKCGVFETPHFLLNDQPSWIDTLSKFNYVLRTFFYKSNWQFKNPINAASSVEIAGI